MVPKRGGAALAPKAEVVWEPKGDLTSVGAVVPNVGGFAVCCPKRGFDSGGAVDVPKVKGDLDSAVVTGAAEGERGFVIGAPADDMAVAGENRFLGAGGLKPDENPLVVVLSCFVPPKVKG